MTTPVVPKLFQPIKVGQHWLGHRVVLAPLTRNRANKDHVHGDLAVEYYSQRASIPGTLLITEATFISPQAGGYDYVPGIWNDDQVAGWKRVSAMKRFRIEVVCDAQPPLGDRRSACQGIAHILPVLDPRAHCEPREPGQRGFPVHQFRRQAHDRHLAYPQAVDHSWYAAMITPVVIESASCHHVEIQDYLEMYRHAARCALKAGFDGVEIHSANGYLIDQFLQDVCNNRTDEYGGSIENRCKFAFEVVEAVAGTIGADKTGIRFSPWGEFQGLKNCFFKARHH